jgi:lipoprotein-anchoring transpeptidase ErfK/SrfK
MVFKYVGCLDAAPRQRLALALIACVAPAAVISAETASAQFLFFQDERPYVRSRPYYGERPFAGAHHHSAVKEKSQKAEEPAPPAGPLFFVISTNNQHVSVYGPGGLYARSPVSTGRPDHPTPHGIFSIIGKERFHESNIYSGAPMPYMQRITWSGVAMHEGVLPGYAASHGCIRMPHDFARRLFGYTQGNERVVISHQDIAPASISNPRLFTPKLMEAPGSLNAGSAQTQILQNALSVATQAEKVDIAVKPDAAEAKPGVQGQKLLNPYEFAKAMQALATKQAMAAAAGLGPARKEIEAKAKEVREAVVTLRKAEIALAGAKDKLESAERQVKRASDEEQSKAAAAARDEAQAKVSEGEAALEAARRAKAEKDQAAAGALRAYNATENVRRAAGDVIKSWNRRLAPLSIFVSRKTQRLYIRQGFVRVFDVPVTIRDPDKPIGTHLYIAMPEQGVPTGALHWLVLSLPDANTASEEEPRRHRRKEEAPRTAQPAASASEALDRIEVPSEVREKISEMLLAGSSLIVSDKPMSGETGEHTDFVILTR